MYYYITLFIFNYLYYSTINLHKLILIYFLDIFDVVRDEKDCVYVIDFSPFDKNSDLLAFEWTELLEFETVNITLCTLCSFKCKLKVHFIVIECE